MLLAVDILPNCSMIFNLYMTRQGQGPEVFQPYCPIWKSVSRNDDNADWMKKWD